jgi:predicted N-acetyltransferase YhbS
MDIIIRQEENSELPVICKLIEKAFADMLASDHQEHYLVDRLHNSDTYIPELSLVAETEKRELVGYILLTKVEIVFGSEVHTSLAVAPLAVLPEYQNRGIGGILLKEAHKRAAALGYGTAVLLGHKDYYPRFGYCKAEDYDITFPFDVPSEYCQVIELIPDALKSIKGIVRYPAVFFE